MRSRDASAVTKGPHRERGVWMHGDLVVCAYTILAATEAVLTVG
jgi:hypothetical protein